jgi:glycosyltransferase involved in cell wall biosynthesis
MNELLAVQPRVLLLTCGAWHLPQTAKVFSERDALAGLWITFGNHVGIPVNKYRRAWPFQLAMLPFYFLAPQIWSERAFYSLFPIWKAWLAQQKFPHCSVVQAIMGYGTEAFDRAEKIDALKILDCPNSHPATYRGIWQRECDRWCTGEKVPIPEWMFARMTRELERADLVIVQSEFCKESMILNGIPEKKVAVHPMGVDTKVFLRRTEVPTRTKFICVGTICLRKGHQYLFRAWEIAKRQLSNAELVCVGSFKRDFRRERLKWEGTFSQIPYLPHSDVAKLLRECTAFVFPSQEEGIGRAQIEALAAGVPVIGTYEAGTPTVVTDGVEGLIVPGRDPEQIAKAMIRLANDRDLNSRMARAAHEKIAAQYSWQQYGDRLLSCYRHALKERTHAKLAGATY